MISTSSAWKEYIKDSSVFHVKATMTGGSTLQLTDSDFMMGSVSFTDSMSGMNEIALGAVVTNTFNATLNNNDGKFDSWDWTEIEVWFGIEVNGNEEWIKRGKYTIDRPSSIGNTIKIECYDYMDKLNTYYSLVTDITYPLEASRLVYYMCQYCGVDYDFSGTTGWQFDTSFNVGTAFADLNDEATTCRQVLSWILQTMGGYARINPSTGYLECKAWNRSQLSPADEITGGIFNVWNAVATTEGGSMNPWSVVADSNGGTYFDGGAYALEKIKRQTIMIDDITVTGIRAFTYNTVDEFDFATAGSGGYILAIQDNPLVGSGVGSDKQTIADRVWANVQGLSVRPFNASMFGDPSIEAGDTIVLRDAKDNYYVSIITNLTFSLGNDMRVSCDAETAESNQLQTANPTTSAIKGAVTAAYDYITAKKISADYITAGTLGVNGKITATDLEITGGEVGNFTIVDGKIQTTYVYPHTYTYDDTSIMNSIISTGRTPTQEELELYDMDNDGVITQEDVIIVSDIISEADGILSSTIILDPSSYKEMIKVTNSLDETSYIGGDGGSFFRLLFNGSVVKDTVIDSFSYNPSRPEHAWFKAFGIELKSGIKMIGGYVDLGSVAMTNSYGNAYYKNVTVNFPIYMFDSTIFSINVSALATTGLISASVNNVSTTGFSVYVFDSMSETVHVYLQYFIIGI